MRRPRNIHELDNVILLRQALDLLEASDEAQRDAYPMELDPAQEMKALFEDAWGRVEPVFWPILPIAAREALKEIERMIRAETPNWDAMRDLASIASDHLPSPKRSRAPRAWLDQIVPGQNHLLVRRQLV